MAHDKTLLGYRDTSPLKLSKLKCSEGHDLVLSITAHKDGPTRIIKIIGAFLLQRSDVPVPPCSDYNF